MIILLYGMQADGCVVGFVFDCRLIILFYETVFHYLDVVFHYLTKTFSMLSFYNEIIQ